VKTERSLLAVDILGTCRVLATDGQYTAECCQEVSSDAEEIGLLTDDHHIRMPGLYLISGTWVASRDEFGKVDGYDFFEDLLRPVKPEELAELYAIEPEEPEPMEKP
jgi:hypothetical protein